MTRIAIYGAGGVGGYFGARLARAGADVHFIARGAHLHALREHGLMVRSVKGDFRVQAQVTDDPADIGPCHPGSADEHAPGTRNAGLSRGNRSGHDESACI